MLGLGAALAFTADSPRDRAEIAALDRQLFEYGAIRFLHAKVASADPLFARVAAGETLTHAESCAYRTAYWQGVADNRTTFKLLDHNIHFATDYGITLTNNCDQRGITGLHDLHDISALRNMQDIRQGLQQIATGGAISRILVANDTNKDLVDLVVHFAPAVHAIGVEDAAFADAGADRAGMLYQTMRAGFKAAQFADVNSCAYWAGVDQALAAHADLVLLAQDRQRANMRGWERRLAGRWLSKQTVAPVLDTSAPLRPRPANCL